MTICSTAGRRARIYPSAGTKSSATVQQRQPLASSTMFSSGHAASPQPLRISPSMPTSPNSFTITANRRPCALRQDVSDQRRLSGTEKAGHDGTGHARGRSCSFHFLEIEWGHAGDEPTLERFGPSAPRHDAVGRAGEKAGAGDERRSAGGIEAAEHVGPGSIAANSGAQAARAVRQASDPPHDNAAAFGGIHRCGRQQCAWTRIAFGFTGMPAGYADVDDGSLVGRCGVGHAWLLNQTSPVPLRRGNRPDLGCLERIACAEAPRPATNRINGRSPGSRVAARHRLPGRPSGNVVRARRLQLRGQLRSWNLRSAPHSLFALS